MINNRKFAQSTYDQGMYDTIRPLPNPNADKCTIDDELRWSMQFENNGIETASQMVAGVHGIWDGNSPQLTQLVGALARSNEALQSTAAGMTDVSDAAESIQYSIHRLNKLVLKDMDTPILRHYVVRMNNMHPNVSQFIADNVDKLLYFRPVSEHIGLSYTIVADRTITNVLDWCKTGGALDESLKTPSFARKSIVAAMPQYMADEIDRANALCGCDFVLNMSPDAFPIVFPDYSEPIAHGLLQTNDVLATKRILDAKKKVIKGIVETLKDQIRLLDQFLPVYVDYRIDDRSYIVPVNGVSTGVDLFGAPIMENVVAMASLAYDAQQSTRDTRY